VGGGYLLIGRQDHTDGLPGADRPAVPLPRQEIHLRYRGLEGEPWPNPPPKLGGFLEKGYLTFKMLPQARKYYEIVANEFLADLLYIEPFTHMGGENELPRDFVMLGFDFGYYHVSDDFTSLKSTIYSEVLFGENEELREMAGELNEHLLFPDNKALKQFSRTLTRNMETKDSAMQESTLGQGFTIFGLPAASRIITPKYVEPAGFLG
jgi:hypothetical protein